MKMSPGDILLIIVIVSIYWLALITIPAFLIRRAITQVVRIFRAHHATEAKNAKTVDELGLRPLSLLDRIGKRRDYKPAALKLLLSAEVIKETFGQRVYLSENGLKKLCLNDDRNRLGLCEPAHR